MPLKKSLSYPFFSISGIIKEPIAEVVATAEPETAPKNIQAMVVTMESPPVIHPRRLSAKFTIRFAIPPVAIRFPASMKNGTAKSVKESVPDKELLINTMGE